MKASASSDPAMGGEEQRASAKKVAQDMLDFINRSATQYHAVGRSYPHLVQ